MNYLDHTDQATWLQVVCYPGIVKIEQITNQKQWDSFVSSLPHSPFLQSWAWGEFQASQGHEVIRIGLIDGKKLAGAAQLLVMKRRVANFIYVPFGPAVDWTKPAPVEPLLAEIIRLAQDKRVDYIRIDPPVEKLSLLEKVLTGSGFRSASSTVQVETGWILDLAESEEVLLQKMRKTTRYLIKKAEKLGVKVNVTTDSNKLTLLLELIHQTARRQTNFFPQPDSYLKQQFELLAKANLAKLYLAYHKRQLLAAAVVTTYGDSYTYLHSGSMASDIPASYLLQWQVIRDAKAEGKSYYDLWGISPLGATNHPWHGVSLFKTGFGGTQVDYTGAWDKPLSARYYLVRLVEGYHQLRRGI